MKTPLTVTLTDDELCSILDALDAVSPFRLVSELYVKLDLLKTGDACRHPDQSPVAVGQGGNHV